MWFRYRRMFPSIELTITGLERRARYWVLLEVEPASDRRHKYVGGGTNSGVGSLEKGYGNARWTSIGPAELQPGIDRRIYLHPDSPETGAHWMQQQPLKFDKLKLTNNAVDPRNNVSVFFLNLLKKKKGRNLLLLNWMKNFWTNIQWILIIDSCERSNINSFRLIPSIFD